MVEMLFQDQSNQSPDLAFEFHGAELSGLQRYETLWIRGVEEEGLYHRHSLNPLKQQGPECQEKMEGFVALLFCSRRAGVSLKLHQVPCSPRVTVHHRKRIRQDPFRNRHGDREEQCRIHITQNPVQQLRGKAAK